MRIMDFREAKACLDEYRISLDATCGMINSNVAKGELGDAIGKLNDSVLTMLQGHQKEALALSVLIQQEMTTRIDQMPDFLEEWTDVLVALDELRVTIDKASKVQADYLQTIAENEAKEAAKMAPHPNALAIQEFIDYRRKHYPETIT
jgi:S-adenosylhomocysteine hydrolase